jgi:HK97 family phage major capsid protein
VAISDANDAMIRRLEKELEERNGAAQGLIANANDAGRDLNDAEKETLGGIHTRMGQLKEQLEVLESTSKQAVETANRLKQIDVAMTQTRKVGNSVVEYRTAGEYLSDYLQAQSGSKAARERLEVFERAAAHQKTSDNPGVVPDPIVGGVVNFIDAARPLVSTLGPRPLTAATWYRPKVTQHTLVDVQGTAGAAADEKSELDSQKMTISRLTGTAVTYGGYVNLARQLIDFSSVNVIDMVVNDLAAQYAIKTEAATAAEIESTGTTAVGYGTAGNETAATIAAALWEAAGTAYTAVKGQGRLVLAVSPGALGTFGPLFAPVNPQNAQSSGFSAGSFAQGVLGTISGIQVVMSAGLTAGTAYVFSTAAVEVFEQRVGSLQVTEPSVLGVQVAYAGYFAPLTIDDDAIIPLTAT